jgi:hypothetical protein
LGDDLEANIQDPAKFLAPVYMMNHLPGLSSKAKVVFFRRHNFTPYPVDTKELRLVLSPDDQISIGERMQVLRKYGVRYFLVRNIVVEKYFAAYPQFFDVRKFGDYWLFEFREMSP